MEKDPAAKDWSVLIIDDEVDNLGVPEGILTFNGATVKTAANAQDGLKLLQDWLPTFVLLDLAMPNMDGWEMHKLLRKDERTKDLAVIALTAHAMIGDKERVLAAGFDGYISKPIDIEKFIAEIKRWLSKRETAPTVTEKPAEVTTKSAEKSVEPASASPDASASKPASPAAASPVESRMNISPKVLNGKVSTDA